MAIHPGAAPKADFAIVSNHWFRDPRLSGKAKGYMGYIATHSIGYRLTVAQMIAEMAEGKDAVYAGLAELVEFGYLVRGQRRAAGERFAEVDYHFGPAAFEPQFDRTWQTSKNRRRAAPTSPMSESAASENPGRGDVDSKKTKTKKNRSGVEWPDAVRREYEDPQQVSDSSPQPTQRATSELPPERGEPPTNWRAEDQRLFKEIIGDEVDSDGSYWTEGTFPAEEWYRVFNRPAKKAHGLGAKKIDWPGRFVERLNDNLGLDSWLEARGLERV